jgi:hypothetical protein
MKRMKKNSRNRKRFKLFSKEQPCSQRSKVEVAQKSNHVLGGK